VALASSGLAAGAAASFQWQANPLTFLCGIFALLTGILGEAKARSPELDGRGKWIARTGLALGTGALVWCLTATV